MFLEILLVGFGGAIGSITRLLLTRLTSTFFTLFPAGILLCNLLGCLIIGLCYGYFEYKMTTDSLSRALIIVGFLGGFTTFSSFSMDSITLLMTDKLSLALMNIFISVIGCLTLTAIGVWISTALFNK